jgi:hypothetical protein
MKHRGQRKQHHAKLEGNRKSEETDMCQTPNLRVHSALEDQGLYFQ